MLKVDVSFKKTTRDMKLYKIVTDKEEKSDFVKDAIEYFVTHQSSQKVDSNDKEG